MITKAEIVNGAYSLLRISGVTSEPTPEEVALAVQVLDDYMAEVSVTMATGYAQPDVYGESDVNDDSNLTNQMAGPIKKMLTVEICQHFGKDLTPSIQVIASRGMRALENLLVSVQPSENPATLPIGSGNEFNYRSNRFYREPTSDDGAVKKHKMEVFTLSIDWSQWADETDVDSVIYEPTSGLTVSAETFDIDTTKTTAQISFTGVGYQQVCVRAVREDGNTDVRVFKYDVSSCDSSGPIWP